MVNVQMCNECLINPRPDQKAGRAANKIQPTNSGQILGPSPLFRVKYTRFLG